MKYYYRDIVTKKLRYTRASFAGWTEPTGLLNAPYAIFPRKSDVLFIPKYLITKETLQAIEPQAQAEKGLSK